MARAWLANDVCYLLGTRILLSYRMRTIEDNYARYYTGKYMLKHACDPIVVCIIFVISQFSLQSASGGQLQLRHYVGSAMIAVACLCVAFVILLVECSVKKFTLRNWQFPLARVGVFLTQPSLLISQRELESK